MTVTPPRSAPGRRAHRVPSALLAAGVLAQIVYPLVSGSARDAVTVGSVVLLGGACVTHAALTRGPRFAAVVVLVTSGIGLLAEWVGVRTGVPFGEYRYAPGRTGVTIGEVPAVIALAWTTGAYPALVVARRLARSTAARVALTAWGLVAWDLYLDPQMVAEGRWVFAHPSPSLPGVTGVPLTNLAGWVAVAVPVAVGLVAAAGRWGPHRTTLRADAVPLILFGWTWLGSAAAHLVLLGLPVSAGYGVVGMGVLGVPLLLLVRRELR